MSGEFRLKNPNLKIDQDYLYHFDIQANDNCLQKRYGDVKYVVMGGKPSRMFQFAEYAYKEMGKPENSIVDEAGKLTDLGQTGGRYAMYKVGPILSLSHGIGMASLMVALHETFKLLHYAKCSAEVKVIRIGTCGGLGVEPGTLVITDKPYGATLENTFEHVILGKKVHWPCTTSPTIGKKLMEYSKIQKCAAVFGNTMSTDDFYLAQCRLDGAFCDYTDNDKMEFLRKAHDEAGIRNIEMESPCITAMCNKAGLECAIICVALLDRLKGDTVNSNPGEHEKWQNRLYVVVTQYIKDSIAGK